mmetsp:Transcript_18380/g.43954  ORF Transcript_18380/g.43954 Transcript_18380/m.43954 type:complete len:366 (-) Transcript_18380:957-2054(-)
MERIAIGAGRRVAQDEADDLDCSDNVEGRASQERCRDLQGHKLDDAFQIHAELKHNPALALVLLQVRHPMTRMLAVELLEIVAGHRKLCHGPVENVQQPLQEGIESVGVLARGLPETVLEDAARELQHLCCRPPEAAPSDQPKQDGRHWDPELVIEGIEEALHELRSSRLVCLKRVHKPPVLQEHGYALQQHVLEAGVDHAGVRKVRDEERDDVLDAAGCLGVGAPIVALPAQRMERLDRGMDVQLGNVAEERLPPAELQEHPRDVSAEVEEALPLGLAQQHHLVPGRVPDSLDDVVEEDRASLFEVPGPLPAERGARAPEPPLGVLQLLQGLQLVLLVVAVGLEVGGDAEIVQHRHRIKHKGCL